MFVIRHYLFLFLVAQLEFVMKDITTIYQLKTEDKIKYSFLDYLGAVLMALAIGIPFAIYFWRM